MINQEERPWLDIDKSFFISANAGSGKTKILVDRILSLILSGVKPSSILCITYTTSGAEEIRDRIMEKIDELRAIKNQEDLVLAVSNIINKSVNKIDAFAINNILENCISPDGQIEISTFHAFCLKIISLFSNESGLDENFAIIDKNFFLKQSVLDSIKQQIFTGDNSSLITDLINVMPLTFFDVIENIINNQTLLNNIDYNKTFANINDCIKGVDNIDIGDVNAYFKNILFESVNFDLAIEAIKYDKIESNFKKAVEAFIANKNYESAIHVYLNSGFEIRKKIANNASNIPAELVNGIYNQALKALDVYHAKIKFIYAKKIYILLRLWDVCGDTYKDFKNQRGFIDFNDIITKTKTLLVGSNHGNKWINFKLGNQINHILVDEAQDTNQNQWDIIIDGILDGFERKNASENKTIFIVGDEKQMIYSFQGSQFMMMNSIYERINKNNKIYKIDRKINFRSSPVILRFVDEVFKDEQILLDYKINVKHVANKTINGCVEVCEPAAILIARQSDTKNTQNKKSFFTQDQEEQKKDVLAVQISTKVAYLLQNGIKPDEIMLLAKSRDNELFEAIFKNLDKYSISIEDISNKKVGDIACVVDAMRFIRICFLNHDLYSLIKLLTSPIFNMQWQQVSDFILNLSKIKGIDVFNQILALNNNFEAEYSKVCKFISQMPAEDVINKMIIEYGGYYKDGDRSGFVYLLNIFEMYKASSNIDGDGVVSLFGFVEFFFANLDLDIKSNTSDVNSVKFSTVHSSKGMESRVIIIIDASREMSASRKSTFSTDGVLCLEFNRAERIIHGCFSAANEIYSLQNTCEDLNLLYVAITRAKEQLYIFSKTESGWYKYLQNAVTKITHGKNFYGDFNLCLANINGKNIKTDNKEPRLIDFCKFSNEGVSKYSFLNKILFSQSKNTYKQNKQDDVSDDELSWLTKSGTDYGTAMHKMLELAGIIKTKQDAEIVINQLNYKAGNVDSLIDNFFETKKLLQSELIKNGCDDLFVDDSVRFEVDVACFAPNEKVANIGRVDMMIAKDDFVKIYDFKTGARSELMLQETYKGQLLFYKKILENSPSFFGKQIECYLVWTASQVIERVI